MMMSVGHCTQRKPQLCGDPCLVVSVSSKASQPQDLSLVQNGGCQHQKPHDATVRERRAIVKKKNKKKNKHMGHDSNFST